MVFIYRFYGNFHHDQAMKDGKGMNLSGLPWGMDVETGLAIYYCLA